MNGWMMIIIIVAMVAAASAIDKVCETIVECKKINSEKFLKYCAQEATDKEEATGTLYS